MVFQLSVSKGQDVELQSELAKGTVDCFLRLITYLDENVSLFNNTDVPKFKKIITYYMNLY